MKQPAINLMPEYILARSQAGVVAGRYLAALLLPIIVLIGPATHSRLMLKDAEGHHVQAQQMAKEALESEATANEIRANLETNLEYSSRYEIVALPLETSRLIATIINDLPASVSLDRIDMAVSWPRHRGAGREAGVSSQERPPRMLAGELAGFAATDEEVADIVARLRSLGICDRVQLDFSRTRDVRGHIAREFRISFRIGLDAVFDVVDRPGSGEVLSHVE
jgi:hypothetical protein